MTDEEHAEDGVSADDTGDLPPPSTWAGKARKADEESPGESEPRGMTEEFEGLADNLSADFDALDADEQEDPPDEFAFEDEDDPGAEEPSAGSDPTAGSDPEFEAESTPEPVEGSDPSVADPSDPTVAPSPAEGSDSSVADPSDPSVPDAGLTVEADTLALSDVEAAREAAHAGLTARAKKSSFSHEVTTGAHKIPAKPEGSLPPPSTRAPDDDSDGVGTPPKRRVGLRFVAAAFVIVSSMAAATAVSFLLFLSDIAEGLNDDGTLGAARAQLEDVEGGAPQTILVLGSDKRESTKGDPGRSDTAILLRVDPDKEFLSLMSLPRDLEVPIPGYGEDKLNAAYSFGEQANPGGGGTELAIKTITDYLDIPINHVVNVDFTGFYEAVNAIGCVYIDIDRHYFNSNEGVFEGSEEFYSEIDVEAGYQKLCGFKALQYVRYRHGDNDLVRGARQQDFIREARQRIPPTKLLPVFGEGDELIDIFTKNTSSDIDDVPTIIAMMKSFVSVREAPVRQVTLGQLTDDGGVDATSEQVDSAVNQFLGNDIDEQAEEPEATPGPKPGNNGSKDKEGQEKPKPPSEPAELQLVDFAGASQEKAAVFAKFMKEKKTDLPIYFPTKLVQSTLTTVSDESRSATLVGPSEKDLYYMYKYVLPFQDTFGPAYYGVSGTDWEDPPILKNPSEYRTVDGREYMLFYERDRLRLVGWRTSKGSYWVNNTLTHSLSEEAMLGIATSTREFDTGN